ncbi:MAG: MFS transporter [Acidobacteriaceae bacterium]|nr:MFS transporter [Acidobacteriaceae bacterium]
MRRIGRRAFHGWWMVLVCALCVFLGPIPIVVFSLGVFLKPLAQEFHSGRAAAVILLLSNLCSGSIWQVYLFYAALGVVGPAELVPYVRVISSWFDRYRGLALGLMMLGMGCGALIMPSLAQYLIARFGWKVAFSISGATMLCVVVPMIAVFLSETPAQMGLNPDGAIQRATIPVGDAHAGASLREAWQMRTFWLSFCSFVLVSASVHACFTHMAPIFADRGTPAQAAALASSLFGGGLLLGRTGSGYFLDRFFAPRVAALIFTGAAAGIALLRVANSQELAYAAAFLIGLGLGAKGDLIPYLASRYFGLRSFGEVYGFTFGGFALAGGLGAYLMGAAFDAKGSYAWPLAAFCILALTGAGLMTRLGPYQYQIGLLVESGPKLEALPSES